MSEDWEDYPDNVVDARNENSKFYFTKKPCRKGHVSLRYTIGSSCMECKTEWHEENRDRELERMSNYGQKNKDDINTRKRHYRKNNAHIFIAYRERNRERLKEIGRRSRLNNLDVRLERERADCKRRAATMAENTAYRRALNKSAVPAWAHRDVMLLFYAMANMHNKDEKRSYHVDHIIPLSGDTVCGLHCEDNLRVITRRENLSKRNELIPELVE